MRRLLPILFLLSAQGLHAASESQPREVGGRRGEGRPMILHATRALSDADRILLKAEGVTVLRPYARGRYIARVSDTARYTGDERVASVEPLTAEKKIHLSSLRSGRAGRSFVDVNVIFLDDVAFDDARAAVLAAGGSMDVFALKYKPSRRIEVRMPAGTLTALAADDRVLAITSRRTFQARSDNAVSAAVSKVNVVQAAPYGLSGAGVTVSLFELAAAQQDHVELNGRFTVTAAGGSTGDKRHATHVAGTIAASGVRAEAKGMAPSASLYQFCVSVPGLNNCEGAWLDLKEDQLAPRGIVADNNSWGYVLGWDETSDLPAWQDADIFWGAYDADVTAPIDEISNEQGILFVHSAGNDGDLPNAFLFGDDGFKGHYHVDPDSGDTLTDRIWCVSKNASGADCPALPSCSASSCETSLHHSQTPFDTMGVTASAKNVLAVGSVDVSLNVSGFSSRGPAKDGRIKPDVVARGGAPGVLSSWPTNAYGSFSGTSMAAPVVTGVTALMTEQWRKTNGGANPSPDQLKAVIIAGADDLGNPGPDYTFGFGLVNAKASADLIIADGGAGQRIKTLSFAQGANQTSHEIVAVVDTPQNLRVVLNWADPSIFLFGNDAFTEQALVNDLDLRVVDPAGVTHLPYALNKNDVNANATRAVNTIDNTEMVDIPNAAPGVYRIIANGKAVTEGPQEAVLVVNARTARPCFDVQEINGERNNTAESAYGNIPSGQLVLAGLCSSTDVDFYKFLATSPGPVVVTVTTNDTAVRATLTGTGISRTQDVPARSTVTLTATANAVPNQLTLKIEPIGTPGIEPQYSFVATYGVNVPPRRRQVRH